MIRRPIFLSVLSGLLLACSWPETGGITLLIFIAFIPLLQLENRIREQSGNFKSKHLFGYTYISFFLWNLITTWWVKNSSFGGAAMAIVFNALFMAAVFQVFHVVCKKMKGRYAFLILTSFWMSFEYLHLRWDLTWPWLTLGNVFASRPWMIQWYEYTGVFGGTLWVFGINFLIFNCIKRGVFQEWESIRKYWKSLLLIVISISFPMLVCIFRQFFADDSKLRTWAVTIVQPNIDPYNEKFSGSYKEQLDKMLYLAESKLDSSTQCVVFPETAIQENLWENDLERTYSVTTLHAFQKRHPGLDILIGATTAYQYKPGETHSPTARKFTDSEEYYEDYNTALFLSGDGPVQRYHKSKFVPGVERMPFPALLKPLEKLAINMGGTTGSLCGQEERTVFVSKNSDLKYAPVICYESVFGDFVAGYIRNGANIICIITNDGWWGDTPGYHQHLDYARLRAIETRRTIVRSANTGTSCFIDEKGNISDPTPWWKPAVLSGKVTLNTRLTFYVKYGDYLALIAIGTAVFFVISVLILRFRKP